MLVTVTERLPIFPLGTVLFPGLILPLHIFEDRYRKLISDLLALPDSVPRRFGVVAIRSGREVGHDGVQALYEVGCTAELRQVQRHSDGRYDVMAVGGGRFTVAALHPAVPGDYLSAEVGMLPEPAGDLAETAIRAAAAFTRYQAALVGMRGEPVVTGDLPNDPVLLSYLIPAAVVMPLNDRQKFLECPDAASRLRLAVETIESELAAIAALPSLPATDITTGGWSPN